MIQNGGFEQTSLDYLRCVHGLSEPNTGFYTFSHKFNEVEYIVFQTSQPQRNTHYYVYQSPYDGNEYELLELGHIQIILMINFTNILHIKKNVLLMNGMTNT